MTWFWISGKLILMNKMKFLLKFQVMVVENLICFLSPNYFLFPDKLLQQTHADGKYIVLH